MLRLVLNVKKFSCRHQQLEERKVGPKHLTQTSSSQSFSICPFFFLGAAFGQKTCADFERFFSKKTPQNEFHAFLQEKVNFPLLKAFRRISLSFFHNLQVLKAFDAFLQHQHLFDAFLQTAPKTQSQERLPHENVTQFLEKCVEDQRDGEMRGRVNTSFF